MWMKENRCEKEVRTEGSEYRVYVESRNTRVGNIHEMAKIKLSKFRPCASVCQCIEKT